MYNTFSLDTKLLLQFYLWLIIICKHYYEIYLYTMIQFKVK